MKCWLSLWLHYIRKSQSLSSGITVGARFSESIKSENRDEAGEVTKGKIKPTIAYPPPPYPRKKDMRSTYGPPGTKETHGKRQVPSWHPWTRSKCWQKSTQWRRVLQMMGDGTRNLRKDLNDCTQNNYDTLERAWLCGEHRLWWRRLIKRWSKHGTTMGDLGLMSSIIEYDQFWFKNEGGALGLRWLLWNTTRRSFTAYQGPRIYSTTFALDVLSALAFARQ